MDNPKLIGARIREIRLSLGLTMEEFIEKIDGKSGKGRSGTVNNWETGQNSPNKKRLKSIASLGNVSVNYLLYGNDNESLIDHLDYLRISNWKEMDFLELSHKLNETTYEFLYYFETGTGFRFRYAVINSVIFDTERYLKKYDLIDEKDDENIIERLCYDMVFDPDLDLHVDHIDIDIEIDGDTFDSISEDEAMTDGFIQDLLLRLMPLRVTTAIEAQLEQE